MLQTRGRLCITWWHVYHLLVKVKVDDVVRTGGTRRKPRNFDFPAGEISSRPVPSTSPPVPSSSRSSLPRRLPKASSSAVIISHDPPFIAHRDRTAQSLLPPLWVFSFLLRQWAVVLCQSSSENSSNGMTLAWLRCKISEARIRTQAQRTSLGISFSSDELLEPQKRT